MTTNSVKPSESFFQKIRTLKELGEKCFLENNIKTVEDAKDLKGKVFIVGLTKVQIQVLNESIAGVEWEGLFAPVLWAGRK